MGQLSNGCPLFPCQSMRIQSRSLSISPNERQRFSEGECQRIDKTAPVILVFVSSQWARTRLQNTDPNYQFYPP